MTVIVYTANFGGHDYAPRVPIPQDIDVDWLYYTEDFDIVVPTPWQQIVITPRYVSSNLSAKVFKCLGPAIGPKGVADVIWIDASMEITSPSFAREALAARRSGIALWRHPRRDCIYDEAVASLGAEAQGGKYAEFDLMAQVASYQAEGYPPHHGLYGCGTIAWDLDNRRSQRVAHAWFDECLRWSPQDQLSFPVVCWRQGIVPGVFPYPEINRRRRTEPWPGYLENDWMRIHEHRTKAA